MTLQQQLTEDMKQAMRAKNMVQLGVIRYLRAEIQNFQIDNGEQDDAGIQKIIASQIKKLKDAVAEFEKAGRTDLVEQETEKLQYMEAYLPQQLTNEELSAIVSRILAQTEERKMSQLISMVLQEVGTRADGPRVSAEVRAQLQ